METCEICGAKYDPAGSKFRGKLRSTCSTPCSNIKTDNGHIQRRILVLVNASPTGIEEGLIFQDLRLHGVETSGGAIKRWGEDRIAAQISALVEVGEIRRVEANSTIRADQVLYQLLPKGSIGHADAVLSRVGPDIQARYHALASHRNGLLARISELSGVPKSTAAQTLTGRLPAHPDRVEVLLRALTTIEDQERRKEEAELEVSVGAIEEIAKVVTPPVTEPYLPPIPPNTPSVIPPIPIPPPLVRVAIDLDAVDPEFAMAYLQLRKREGVAARELEVVAEAYKAKLDEVMAIRHELDELRQVLS